MGIWCHGITFSDKFGNLIALHHKLAIFFGPNCTGDRQIAKLAIFGPKIAKKKVWLKMLKIVQFVEKLNKKFWPHCAAAPCGCADRTVRPKCAAGYGAQLLYYSSLADFESFMDFLPKCWFLFLKIRASVGKRASKLGKGFSFNFLLFA